MSPLPRSTRQEAEEREGQLHRRRKSASDVASSCNKSLCDIPLEQLDKRAKIGREIIETEKTYVTQLRALKEFYFDPLMQMARTETATKVKEAEVKNIFANLDLIIGLNEELYHKMEERTSNWSEVSLIGDIFLKIRMEEVWTQMLCGQGKAST